ncbi:hypothetical protein Fmac_008311 [Flemingia macrophylla]|uniref:Uncharacterized protein n=1 Tax=Flemingia macrophylla TaxID=520843 RepID=A0ABD1MX27_9FABA
MFPLSDELQKLLQASPVFTFANQAPSCPGGSESTSVDPVDEEIIRNKSLIVAAGGITNRGRFYGVGKVGSTLRLGDTFTNFSSGRFTPESAKILQLEQQVRQSREEAPQSRDEARQSREQNERLQHRDAILKQLWHHSDAIMCCSVKTNGHRTGVCALKDSPNMPSVCCPSKIVETARNRHRVPHTRLKHNIHVGQSQEVVDRIYA